MEIKNFFILVLCLIFIGCNEGRGINQSKEILIKELYSNNKLTSIKIIEQQYGGATGDYKYEVLISNKDKTSKLLLAEKVKSIDVKWEDEKTAILSIDSDRIHHFQNFWYNSNSGVMYKIILKNK